MTYPLAASGDRGRLPLANRWWLLLPYAVFVVHSVEEMPGFAAWASRHFAHKSIEVFAVSHIPLILMVLAAGWLAARPGTHRGAVMLTAAFAWQFVVNAAFHVTTAVAFGEYSPGMVTAATVAVPAAGYFFVRLRGEGLLRRGRLYAALALGTVIAAAAIGVLFV
ncbi:MAG: HXXEE domain-containing protein [Stackebrandtia sp.]